MRNLARLVLVGLVSSALPAAFGAFADSVAEFHLALQLDANPALQLTFLPCAIGGSLGGDGSHEERWGVHARWADPANQVPPGEGDYPIGEPNPWGPTWPTEAQVMGDTIKLSLLTMADAAYPPESYAWARTSAVAGNLAEVSNLSEEAQLLTFTVFRSLIADVGASAGPGEYAFAEASWGLALTLKGHDLLMPLLRDQGRITASASMGGSDSDAVNVSGVLHLGEGEGAYQRWLAPGERVQFSLDQATLFSRAVAVPEAGSVAWGGAALSLAAACILRRRLAGRG